MTENSNSGAPPAAGPKLSAGMGEAEAAQSRSAALAEVQAFRSGTHPMAERFMKGDAAAREHIERVHRAAYPDSEPEGTPEGDADLAALRSETAAPPDASAYKLDLWPGAEPMPAELAGEIRSALHASGLPASTAAILWRIGTGLVRNNGNAPASPEAIKAQRLVAEQQLVGRFGEQDAEALVRDAREIVKRMTQKSPRVAALLEASGLGNDMNAIQLLANLARAQRAAGRSAR